jgi:microcystin-dependent protein
MSNCSNCYNGCTDIQSDKCVKYTGIDVPALGIKNGDSLSYVEQALTTYLVSVMDGQGIKINISEVDLCETVSIYLPECRDITALDLFRALVKAVCDLKIQIDSVQSGLLSLEAPYSVDCLTGVESTDGTHDILQATITKLCSVESTLEAFIIDVENNYVQLSELNTLIQAYIDGETESGGAGYAQRMVPFSIIPYYGTLSNFDLTGAGIALWEKIYLCNGQNGTPDLRGRVLVGTISGVPGSTPSSDVNPASNPVFNPNYSLGDTAGSNSVTLSTSQIPSHNHTATTSLSDPGHKHDILGISGGDNDDNNNTIRFAGGDKNNSETGFHFTNNQACQNATTGISVGVTVATTGGGQAHDNKQPSRAVHYIMYIP